MVLLFQVEAKRSDVMLKLDFNRTEYDKIKEDLMLNEEMSKILEMRIKGYSITKMAIELNLSESAINRRIKELKKKIKKII